MPSAILDASALLAYLRDEPGADVVADAVATGAVISTVNLGEVLSRVADRDTDPARVARQMTDRGLLDGAIAVEPFTTSDAIEVARLRPLTRDLGLSLGDRACLALAKRMDAPVLTADSAWSKLDLPLELRQIH
ncbi:MAG: type II toxin-antitoxin system VapC family toxin [Actinobacteria bacterium]|nr:type II toxin-antitoxin system VapC family toxin [Actinomycetota bacterium]